MFELPDFDAHERVGLFHDPATGLRAIIAIHSTALGPAAGGCRLWRYPGTAQALTDALRLSRGMSYKNAMAGLALGGGKAVLLGPLPHEGGPGAREAAFHAFGDMVDSLGGSYVTAEDVGVSVEDMRAVAGRTQFVSGLPTDAGDAAAVGGDPSPFTARGTLRGIEAVARHRLGRSSLDGLRISVQGLGHVGGHLCALLAEAGAVLTVADTDHARAAAVAAATHAEAVAPGEILARSVDIFAPCAMGAVVTQDVAHGIEVAAICGAANNQLATPRAGAILAERGIAYAPDYVVNAGGIIAIAAEYLGGQSRAEVLAQVDAIGPRISGLLERAAEAGLPPGRLADTLAQERIAAGRRAD